MSHRKSNTSVRKPYCKVCHDAGKPESEYTSHYVKETDRRTGIMNVICPTLLNTECRYCFGLGHTAKFCPAIAAKGKPDMQIKQRDNANKKASPVVQEKPKNRGGFAALLDDDDEEPIKEEFPALCASSANYVPSANNSYAAMASRPAATMPLQQKPKLPTGFVVLEKSVKDTSVKDTSVTIEPLPNGCYRFTAANGATTTTTKTPCRTSWVDYTSDDEEEEDHFGVNEDNSAWD